jgi:hypothetical protein
MIPEAVWEYTSVCRVSPRRKVWETPFGRFSYRQVKCFSGYERVDWDLLLKLSKVGKVVAIPDHLANIRYYPETKTNMGGWKRMREIARIGRRHNGILDRNNLSFQIRDILAKQPFNWPCSLFDHFCWNLFKNPPLMVQGWPEEKIQN